MRTLRSFLLPLLAAFSLLTALSLGGCAKGAALGIGGGTTATSSSSSSSGQGGAGGGGSDGGSEGGPIPCLHQTDCAALTGACSIGSCVNNVCVPTVINDGMACDDGLFCTTNDTCTSGSCVGTPMLCTTSDPCQTSTCDEAMKACSPPMAGNDGNACAPTDPCFSGGECSSGTCVADPTQPTDCSFLDSACTTGTCVSGTGCMATPVADMTACESATGDPCSPGVCMAGNCNVMALPDNSPCTGCSPGECQGCACLTGTCTPTAQGDGSPCDDSNFCTTSDTCTGGVCAGVTNPCGPSNGCWTNTCDPVNLACSSTMLADGTACDDGDACNTGKTCKAGLCTGGTPVTDGAACGAALSCTTGATCVAGACTGGTGPTIYFQEHFDDNTQGWTLDTEWAIGAAMTSTCQMTGGPDPSFDHPDLPPDGVGGVVIGGCADTTTVHPKRYLTSPAFDTSAATGTVVFQYYRWLNSDVFSMVDTVDVFDGTTWQNVWTDADDPNGTNDGWWSFVAHDVTAYKNAKMQVRFGFDIEELFGISASSWNVDDVLVSSANCPTTK